jgi:hypothetical protein
MVAAKSDMVRVSALPRSLASGKPGSQQRRPQRAGRPRADHAAATCYAHAGGGRRRMLAPFLFYVGRRTVRITSVLVGLSCDSTLAMALRMS